MKSGYTRPTLGLVLFSLLFIGVGNAQTNLAANSGLENTSQGNPPCIYTWENDGPCAPEYFVQQYPDEAFSAGLQTLNGDNVFAVEVLRGDLAPISGNPKVNFKYTLQGVSPGEVYAFSVAVRTDDLLFETSLRATPKGPTGAIPGAQVIQKGPRQTAPWQRFGLQVEVPEGATAIDFLIYVSGTLGICVEECGAAYFDDIEISRVENLAPNADLSVTATGDPPCIYTWENDGPCAPEYYVQQYPDEPFRAEIENLAGDNVFTVEALRDDVAPTSGNPKVNFKYTLNGVTPGEVYAFSTSVSTKALLFDTSLRATPKGPSGAISGAQVIQSGPNQTTPWQRFGLQVKVPEGATAIDFLIYVSGTLGACGGGHCGAAYFDDLSITRVPTHPFTNVCPDGQYLDWARTENDCKDLEVDLAQLDACGLGSTLEELHTTPSGESTFDPSRIFTATDTHVGFKPGAFEAAFVAGGLRDDHFEAAGCTEAAVDAALDAAELNGGGTVTLPACEIVVHGQIEVPANTIVQGAGIGRTVLVPNVEWNGSRLFEVREVENVVIRDLTLDALHNHGNNRNKEGEGSTFGILFEEFDNVLVERVEAKRARLTAFDFRIGLNFTVRNSVAADTATHHGFATSDCQGHEMMENCPDLGTLDWYWLANHAVYSNLVTGNARSGVNSHGVLAEIAGNRIVGNTQGSKFSQARYFWVHDNLYAGNAEASLRLQPGPLTFRPSKHLLIYRNWFLLNGSAFDGWTPPPPPTPQTLDLDFKDPPPGPGSYLIDNDFEGNQGRIMGLDEDLLCAGTDEVLEYPPFEQGMTFDDISDWQIRYGFNPDILPADHPICELSNIHTIFPSECSEP